MRGQRFAKRWILCKPRTTPRTKSSWWTTVLPMIQQILHVPTRRYCRWCWCNRQMQVWARRAMRGWKKRPGKLGRFWMRTMCGARTNWALRCAIWRNSRRCNGFTHPFLNGVLEMLGRGCVSALAQRFEPWKISCPSIPLSRAR